ncbi:hypothetical protein MACJ_000044 [Theileria orientalis]|uniref:Uncharacterized protein n=1 Tax=Theileria orientalis TaxID=68886 RepID=A0A976M3F1_THEOR|nr:hypothetical protein MACJ_000044 [Theileria orientalis]
MINSKNNLISKPSDYRLSVLDALLNRDVSENYSNDRSSEPADAYSDSEKRSHRISHHLSQNSSDFDVGDSVPSSPLLLGTKTPTNRAEQLPLLLARNYYTAPACLLRFVNTTSSIRSSPSEHRDSDETVIDNQFDPIDDFNLDTNDDIDMFKSDEEVPEILSIGTFSNKSSLMRNNQLHHSDDFGYVDTACVDLNLVLQSVNSKYGSHFDKGCSPLFHFKETNYSGGSKDTVDVGTSPLLFDTSHKTNNFAFNGDMNSDSQLMPEDTKLDSYYVDRAKNFNTTDPEPEFSSPGFESEKEHTHGPRYSTLKSGDFSVKKSEFSNQRQMPVYCRSLLYRIRVPLSKRLKNVDEDVLVKSMASPLHSESRANLSCDRLFSTRPRLSNSVDSSRSFLRLSDLDSYSVDSSRSDMKTAKRLSGSNDGDKRHKREYSSFRPFEGISKRSKRYNRVR